MLNLHSKEGAGAGCHSHEGSQISIIYKPYHIYTVTVTSWGITIIPTHNVVYDVTFLFHEKHR